MRRCRAVYEDRGGFEKPLRCRERGPHEYHRGFRYHPWWWPFAFLYEAAWPNG